MNTINPIEVFALVGILSGILIPALRSCGVPWIDAIATGVCIPCVLAAAWITSIMLMA